MAVLTLKFVTDVADHEYGIVEFHGELDQSTLADAEAQINEMLKNFSGTFLIFDLGDLGFINSEGIGFFISIQKQLSSQKKELVLCGPKNNVAEVMTVMGLERLMKIFKIVADALNYLKKA